MIGFICLTAVAILSSVHQANGCCCCGSSGSGSRKQDNSMNGMIMGFLLARMSTGNAALASTYRNALLLKQYPTNPMDMLLARASPISLHRLRLLRQQNGFGFLWGTKRARRLKSIAEVIGAQKHLHGWPFTAVQRTTVKENTKLQSANSTVTIPPDVKQNLKTKVAGNLNGRTPALFVRHGPLPLGSK